MKILIAVVSCHKHRDRNQAQRDTWIPGIKGADVRFFMGEPISTEPLSDEVYLSIPDDYEHLPYKTKAMIQWALANGYDKTFKVDSDTWIYSDRLMAAVPTESYVGFLNNMPPKPWCSGFSYWLDERAMRIVAAASIPLEEWAEDRWIGGVLHDHGISPYYDKRYAYLKPPMWRVHDPNTVIAICDAGDGEFLPTRKICKF
jgi:Galactosyltransferase